MTDNFSSMRKIHIQQLRLGQPVVVVPFVPSGGWRTLEERRAHLATTVVVPSSTKGMVVDVVELPHSTLTTIELYKILWETEETSWHHSSLIHPLTLALAEAEKWDENL